MGNDIRANVENIHQVVQTFSNELADYKKQMEQECQTLATAIAQLGEGWQAGDYDKFASSINEKIAQIKAEMNSAGKLKDYLDNVAVELKGYLEKLKQASE